MRALILALMLILFAIPADADHCSTWTTTNADVDTGVAPGGPRYYFDADATPYCYGLCTYWVYEEANGIDGLQRRDEIRDDTCHDMIDGDTVVF